MAGPKQLTGGITDAARATRDAELLKQIGEAKKQTAAVLDRLARIEELLTAGQTSTRALVIEFRRGWEQATGEPYLVVSESADMGVMRHLLRARSAEDIRARMTRYFENHSNFVRITSRYSLALFASQGMINTLGGSGRGLDAFVQEG